jgi:hypothetical protein
MKPAALALDAAANVSSATEPKSRLLFIEFTFDSEQPTPITTLDHGRNTANERLL